MGDVGWFLAEIEIDLHLLQWIEDALLMLTMRIMLETCGKHFEHQGGAAAVAPNYVYSLHAE